MDVVAASPEDNLQLDFDAARLELAAARMEQHAKDTPATRRQVAECRTRMDWILDMWHDVPPTSA